MDNFTLDGRLRPQLGVTRAKVGAAKTLLEKALAGDIIADAQLREAVTSSDAQFNIAHLMNLQFTPQLPEKEKSIAGLVSFRTVRDFNPVQLYSLWAGKVEGAGVDANGAAAIVPEGTRYPLVSVKSDQEAFWSKLDKRGFRFDFTWEARINDTVGFFDGLPQELLDTTIDTQYAEIFDALEMASQALPAVTLPDETTTLPNALVSPEAIVAGQIAIAEREINGRKIGTLSAFNVFVPVGRKLFLEYAIKRYFDVTSIEQTEGNTTLVLRPAQSRDTFPDITIIETDRLTGTNWKMVPKPGTTRRPVWEMLRLRGYELPELRVNNVQGTYLGGARISPFEGSFEADSIQYRYRYVVGGVLWDDSYVIVSNGTGVA